MRHRFSARNIAVSVGSFSLTAFVILIQLGVPYVPVYVVFGTLAGAGFLYAAYDFNEHVKHREKLVDFASKHGWKHRESAQPYARRFFSYPFDGGGRATAENVLTGRYNGQECATFTLSFQHESDDTSARSGIFQITLVELGVSLPTVDIVPDGAFASIAKFLGGQDIDFESAEFNRRWRVKARNARFAHDILHPRVLERLARPDTEGFAVRFENDAVLCWQAGRVGIEGLATRLGMLTTIAGLVPPHIRREYAGIDDSSAPLAQSDAQYQDWLKRHSAEQQKRFAESEAKAPEWARNPTRLTDGKYNPDVPLDRP